MNAADEKKSWICNKCDLGVLDDVTTTPSSAMYFGTREAVRICPECGEENPMWLPNMDDPDIGVKWPDDNIQFIAGGLPKPHLPPAAFRDGPGSYVQPRYKFGEDTILLCPNCGVQLELYGFADYPPKNCPECGHFTRDLNNIELKAGGIDPDFKFKLIDTGKAPAMLNDTGLGFDGSENITFVAMGKEIGKLTYNDDDLEFEGNAELSCSIFIQAFEKALFEWFDQQYLGLESALVLPPEPSSDDDVQPVDGLVGRVRARSIYGDDT